MDAVCKTSIPFGWDDCEKSDTMKQVAVALFNKILEKVGLQELFCEVEDKIEKVVLPSYMEASNVTTTSENFFITDWKYII